MKLNNVCVSMMEYYYGDAKRIQHFIKVHALAKLIAEQENLSLKVVTYSDTKCTPHG